MKNIFLSTAFVLASIVLTACSAKNTANVQTSPASPKIETQIPADVLKNAVNLYAKKKSEGTDFSSGPCLGKIANDWVLDIAHNPRQATDDKPNNQCADFRNGTVHHFIELDIEGKLIRAK